MAKEHEIYKSVGVRVTNLRVILGERIYAVANIASVGMSEERPNRTLPLLLFGVGTVSLVWFARSIWNAPDNLAAPDLTMNYLALLLGVLGLAGGFLVGRSQKARYLVHIGDASGESDALSSDDKAQIEEVVRALREAIIEQG